MSSIPVSGEGGVERDRGQKARSMSLPAGQKEKRQARGSHREPIRSRIVGRRQGRRRRCRVRKARQGSSAGLALSQGVRVSEMSGKETDSITKEGQLGLVGKVNEQEVYQSPRESKEDGAKKLRGVRIEKKC